MGAPAQLRALRDGPSFRYRLGLSATPERWFDEDATNALYAYFGPIVFEYTLKEALADGVLVPYDYFPELVQLTGDEREEYLKLSRRLAALGGGGEKGNEEQSSLLFRRARLLAGARNKLPHLRSLITKSQEGSTALSQALVYCGDGTVETDIDDPNPNERRYVEEVADLLGFDLHIRCSVYVAETKLKQRLQMQEDLATGRIQAIVAIRCLDEGVDIPSVKTAFILASSRNPRQFIQRRGRVLRRDDASGKTHATIFDFVVVPPDPQDEQIRKSERSLLKAELRRVIEFARLSRNEGVTLQRLRALRTQYNLLGYDGSDNGPEE